MFRRFFLAAAALFFASLLPAEITTVPDAFALLMPPS